jgi:DNA-binding beta-propeller fold protein YncE
MRAIIFNYFRLLNEQVGETTMAKKRLITLLCVLPMISLCFACATAPPKLQPMFLPGPPDEPKLALIKIFRGEVDVVPRSFMSVLMGDAPANNLIKPFGVAARNGKIYITDTGMPRVLILDPREQRVVVLGDSGGTKLSLPLGIAVAEDGTIFVSDGDLKKVIVYDEKGKVKNVIGKRDDFQNNAGLAYNDGLKRLYVVDSYGNTVRVFTDQGEPLFQFGQNGPADGEFFYPTMIAIDRRNDNVAIVDTQHFKVQVFDKDGRFLKKFGQLGDTAGSFTRPKGVGIDSEGNIYVSDAAFDNVQIFNENTQLLLVLGSAGVLPGSFQLPAGTYVDENDRLYVVDQLNRRVQVYQYMSEKWKREHPDEYKILELELQQANRAK